MASQNVVAYATIQDSMSSIDESCNNMMSIAQSMSDEIDTNVGQGKGAWSGTSAGAFQAQWKTFADTTFPQAKKSLDTLVNAKMKTWMTEYNMTEEEIQGAIASLKQG